MADAEGDEQADDGQLDDDDDVIDQGALGDALHVDQGDDPDDGHSRQIDEAPFFRRRNEFFRQSQSQIGQDIAEIAGPADGHGAQGQGVFQNQIPADDPGPKFA